MQHTNGLSPMQLAHRLTVGVGLSAVGAFAFLFVPKRLVMVGYAGLWTPSAIASLVAVGTGLAIWWRNQDRLSSGIRHVEMAPC